LVARVELGSPGFWEFAGALNPLEAIRKYLNDNTCDDRTGRIGSEKKNGASAWRTTYARSR
jgi:hypothetical protein